MAWVGELMHLWVQLDKIRKAFLIKIKDVNTAYAEVELTITSYVIVELTWPQNIGYVWDRNSSYCSGIAMIHHETLNQEL